jgi:PAS domain-containing protein
MSSTSCVAYLSGLDELPRPRSVGIFDWHLGKRSIYLSPTLQDMLGYGGEDMPGHLDAWVDHLHADDRFNAQRDVREALVYGKESFRAVYRIRRRDGQLRRFLFQATIFRKERVKGGDAVRAKGVTVKRILAIDLGNRRSLVCDHHRETSSHEFVTIPTRAIACPNLLLSNIVR